MAENKTKPTDESVMAFIQKVENDQKKRDSYRLIEIMREISNCEPLMWGSSIIGFGNYHYRYESGREGDAPLIGFSPRKSAISLYVFTGLDDHLPLLEGLGKYKKGKACIYIKKLEDININVLKELMSHTIKFLKTKYG